MSKLSRTEWEMIDRLYHQLAVPRPRIYVFPDRVGIVHSQTFDPSSGRLLVCVTAEVYAELKDKLFIERPATLEEYCEIVFVPHGYREYRSMCDSDLEQPTGVSMSGELPDHFPYPHEIRLGLP